MRKFVNWSQRITNLNIIVRYSLKNDSRIRDIRLLAYYRGNPNEPQRKSTILNEIVIHLLSEGINVSDNDIILYGV